MWVLEGRISGAKSTRSHEGGSGAAALRGCTVSTCMPDKVGKLRFASHCPLDTTSFCPLILLAPPLHARTPRRLPTAMTVLLTPSITAPPAGLRARSRGAARIVRRTSSLAGASAASGLIRRARRDIQHGHRRDIQRLTRQQRRQSPPRPRRLHACRTTLTPAGPWSKAPRRTTTA